MGTVIKLFKTKQERRNLSYQASVDALIPEAMEYADFLMLREHGPPPHKNNQRSTWCDWATLWDRCYHKRMDRLCQSYGVRIQAYQKD